MLNLFKKKQNQSTPEKSEENHEKEPKFSNGKISFEQFSSVEIRIGEILSAEKVENADRLLKLVVDFGEEKRKIVSGIAEFYQPDLLIGLKCPFVTNLEPRTIKGEESNGMILAARDQEGNFSILQVDQKIGKGTKIS